MATDPEALFHEHHVPLFRYLLRLTGDSELAADSAQEAFARMIERRPNPEHPRAWLYTVATNAARESLRSRGRHAELIESGAQRLAPDPAPAPDEVAVAMEDARLVRDALATLPPRDRMVLLMREEGFLHREIAEAVGTTTRSIGTMIARAMVRLANALDPDLETG